MFAWTPAERRGAAIVALLLAIGTLYDLSRGHGRVPAPRGREPETTAAPASTNSATLTNDSPASSGVPAPAAVALVDLNRATAGELDALPGIGPVLAGRIVAHRVERGPYRAVEDLLDVPGIGPTLLERLRPRVTTGR